jgi:hypothetical protein
MQCILYKIYFWKVFHMNYNLICIFICTPICANLSILVKSWCHKKCGSVAYKIDLPPSLAGVHDIFHVLQLKKCLKAPVDVVLPEVTPLKADLSYPEHPIKVLDQKDHVTRRKIIKFFKIQWSNHSEEEATWESDDFLHSHHPYFVRSCALVRCFC